MFFNWLLQSEMHKTVMCVKVFRFFRGILVTINCEERNRTERKFKTKTTNHKIEFVGRKTRALRKFGVEEQLSEMCPLSRLKINITSTVWFFEWQRNVFIEKMDFQTQGKMVSNSHAIGKKILDNPRRKTPTKGGPVCVVIVEECVWSAQFDLEIHSPVAQKKSLGCQKIYPPCVCACVCVLCVCVCVCVGGGARGVSCSLTSMRGVFVHLQNKLQNRSWSNRSVFVNNLCSHTACNLNSAKSGWCSNKIGRDQSTGCLFVSQIFHQAQILPFRLQKCDKRSLIDQGKSFFWGFCNFDRELIDQGHSFRTCTHTKFCRWRLYEWSNHGSPEDMPDLPPPSRMKREVGPNETGGGVWNIIWTHLPFSLQRPPPPPKKKKEVWGDMNRLKCGKPLT